MKRFAAFVTGVSLLAGQAGMAQMGAPGERQASLPASSGPLAAKYKSDADKIIAAAMSDNDGYAALAYLTDHVGKRLSGSTQLNTAVAWGAELMKKAGLENVQVQPVMVPRWVRGEESATITYKGEAGTIVKPLHMLGLGMSVGTPKKGITAPAVFVHDFAELDKLPDSEVKGRIVVFNPGWHGYGVGSMYRVGGPSRAAARGAAAVLVRSATGLAMQTPHTGTLRYDEKQAKIPAAAISVEDAMLIERLAKEGPVTVHLAMEAHMEPDVKAGNVMGEIVGSEHPEQVVVLGGHIDSWDVGQGAQDDGGGIISAFEAVSLLHKLGLKPKRTIRVVFWVNEENGDAGGIAYRKWIGDRIGDQVAAIESDMGVEKPLGIGYGGFFFAGPRRAKSPASGAAAAPALPTAEDFDVKSLPQDAQQSFATLQDIASLLVPIGADTVLPGGGGSDIGPTTADGVPALAPRTVGEHYFDWHHTEADTFDKVDEDAFKKNTALLYGAVVCAGRHGWAPRGGEVERARVGGIGDAGTAAVLWGSRFLCVPENNRVE
ncbi:MAG: M20/M25/M40 family metallo-hydrolase [Edaphobacter sp.]|uniref:M20/M25/M40 family metallo-hydrolase n=1 Tax=Edaphobacter sp. TaxID=1934404 RepID=UPI0023953830|nr:M20/M25/M40 family metallo-hydrolase [Edaphobacter sp.]MDE1177027.1 M20/M25/M40 family metallo-hydrolase [Edaphobacter sp.]